MGNLINWFLWALMSWSPLETAINETDSLMRAIQPFAPEGAWIVSTSTKLVRAKEESWMRWNVFRFLSAVPAWALRMCTCLNNYISLKASPEFHGFFHAMQRNAWEQFKDSSTLWEMTVLTLTRTAVYSIPPQDGDVSPRPLRDSYFDIDLTIHFF